MAARAARPCRREPDAADRQQPHRQRRAGRYDITFYGSSFIANQFGEKVAELNETEEGVLVHSFDLDELEHIRSAWGTFRDRRPNLYGAVKTLDGSLES